MFEDRQGDADEERNQITQEEVLQGMVIIVSSVLHTMRQRWEAMQQMYEVGGSVDFETQEACLDGVVGFEADLRDLQEEVEEWIDERMGYNEPLPTEQVVDFEASVLRDIARV